MITVFYQIVILLLFVSAGYILGKCKIVNGDHTKILSALLVYVFLPANIFKTFSANCTIPYITSGYRMFVVSIIILLILAVSAYFAAKPFSKNRYERCVYEYSLVVPNYGYMGYALAGALLGETGLMNMMIFGLPVSLYIYTIGYAKLTKRKLSLKKLCNPIIITTLVGIIVGLSGLKVPDVLSDFVGKASVCMAPVAMILAGIVLSGFEMKKMVSNGKIYVLVFLRMILIPVAVGLILSLFGARDIAQIAVMFYALPCGMNTVVFPKLVDENCEIGAGIALVSTLISAVSLPLLLQLFHLA